jgi:thiol-disulfide isomerase/thioredoxin
MENLIFFYGNDCTHCKKIEANLERLEKEAGIKVTKLEVWNNSENEKKMESLDNMGCGGVPFLINTKSKKAICGEATYSEVKLWAEGM